MVRYLTSRPTSGGSARTSFLPFAIVGLLNLYVGIYWRALIALAAIGLAILYQRTRQLPGRVPTWLVVGCDAAFISAIVTNGFSDRVALFCHLSSGRC